METQQKDLRNLPKRAGHTQGSRRMKKVVILQKSIPQYRIPFFNLLREDLAGKGIELDLIYGNTVQDNRKDSAVCAWARFVNNKTFKVGSFSFVWQPCMDAIRDADLVIAEHAHKLLFNNILFARKLLLGKKFALWGHGLNMQLPEEGLLNKFKKLTLKQPSWWFAYTSGRKDFLARSGVPAGRITAVENAIDTYSMNREYHDIPPHEVEQLRKELNIDPQEKVLIYCGALSPEKNMPFLVAAADKLRRIHPGFQLVILGSGPYAPFLEKAATERPWLHFVGPKFGREKTLYFRMADLFVLPGAIGLAILDAFAYETPMVSVVIPNHAPEVEYLMHNQNGLLLPADADAYAQGIANLLSDEEGCRNMQRECARMVTQYNLQRMVANFAQGVEAALRA